MLSSQVLKKKKKWRNPQFSSVTPRFQPISKPYKHWLANTSRSQWLHTSCSSTLWSKPPLSLVLTITTASWPVFLLTHVYHPHCWLSDCFQYIKLWHNYAQNYPRASYLTQSQIEGNSGPRRGLQGPIWHPPLPVSSTSSPPLTPFSLTSHNGLPAGPRKYKQVRPQGLCIAYIT